VLSPTYDKEDEVGDGEAEKVVVSGGAHVARAGNHDAREQVPEHARHEYRRVDGQQHDGKGRLVVPRAQLL